MAFQGKQKQESMKQKTSLFIHRDNFFVNESKFDQITPQEMCCAGCDELKKSMKKCKESSLFSYISITLEVWNLNIRFNMVWLSVLHRYGTGCIFTTRIERQHVARLIESALVYISFY